MTARGCYLFTSKNKSNGKRVPPEACLCPHKTAVFLGLRMRDSCKSMSDLKIEFLRSIMVDNLTADDLRNNGVVLKELLCTYFLPTFPYNALSENVLVFEIILAEKEIFDSFIFFTRKAVFDRVAAILLAGFPWRLVDHARDMQCGQATV